MNISAPFIRRPVGTILLTIGLALAGLVAFFKPRKAYKTQARSWCEMLPPAT